MNRRSSSSLTGEVVEAGAASPRTGSKGVGQPSASPPRFGSPASHAVEEAIRHELSRLGEYYLDRPGHGLWVMVDGNRVTGSVGLERAGPDSAELRRMIVAAEVRRCGRGTALLLRAEREAAFGYDRLVLETSTLQPAAMALYERAGYVFERRPSDPPAAHKGVGGPVVRRRYSKSLGRRDALTAEAGVTP